MAEDKMRPNQGQGEIVIYQAEDGLTKVECRSVDETVWLTQQQMAELFHTSIFRIEFLKHILEMLSGKSSCTESGISSQNIVYIIESFVIGCKVLILHLKRQLITNLYIMGIIFDFRSCKATGWTLVITQLTIVVKTVFQPGTTLFTKNDLPVSRLPRSSGQVY